TPRPRARRPLRLPRARAERRPARGALAGSLQPDPAGDRRRLQPESADRRARPRRGLRDHPPRPLRDRGRAAHHGGDVPRLALALMDYTLYLWHVLTHRVPWLWRFHLVHHVDRDLDASTALRFHCAELVISIPWRAAQVLVIGVSPLAFTVWQTALLVSTLF